MKKLLLFCSLLTATFTPLIAQNVGTKLIREDRIWLYRGYVHGSPQFGYEYQMRFERPPKSMGYYIITSKQRMAKDIFIMARPK